MTTKGADGRIIDADRRTALRTCESTDENTDESTGEQAGETGRKWVRWTVRMKEQFLDTLAATGSISGAAAAIGVGASSVYQLRRRDAAFAAAWREAVVLAYDVLETLVVGHALSGSPERTIEGYQGAIDVDHALRLLARHRDALRGKPFTGGPRIAYATRVETDRAILRALDALDRRKARAAPATATATGTNLAEEA